MVLQSADWQSVLLLCACLRKLVKFTIVSSHESIYNRILKLCVVANCFLSSSSNFYNTIFVMNLASIVGRFLI